MQWFARSVFLSAYTAAGLWALHSFAQARFFNNLKDHSLYEPPPLASSPPWLAELFTLGHRNVYEDLIAISLVQTLMVNHDVASESTFKRLEKLVDTVFSHSPQLESVYVLACYTFFNDFNKPDASENVALKGMRVFRKSWRLPLAVGFINQFHLKNAEKAFYYYSVAAARPRAPAWLKRAAENMYFKNEFAAPDEETYKLFPEADLDLIKAVFEDLERRKDSQNDN